jgi:flagellar hook protein FlgE
MLGSIFIGLSGMNAFSNGLRQISNNITNINSLGYKSADLSFVNLFGAGAFAQGQGVAIADARIDFAQGELRQTDRALDLAIDGQGFLVLLKDSGHFYARTGSFEVNADGDIVLAGTDYKLTVLDDTGSPTALSVADHRIFPPQATTTIKFAENLSSSTLSFQLSDIKVFDAQGIAANWSVRFERTATSPPGEWSVIVSDGTGEVGRQTLKFIASVVDPTTERLTFTDADGSRSVVLDFSQGVSSFSSGEVSTLRVADIDGFGGGELTEVRVNDKGEIELAYSNDQTKSLGAVTLAHFRDPQSLEPLSNGLFTYDGAHGREFLTSASERVGQVVSKRLEASNVDLSREFGDLILVQRGYQASSQVVSVSNDMIQQLFGIRGQG